MNRAHTFARLSRAIYNTKGKNLVIYQSPISATLLVHQSRCMAGHGPPAHWKSPKQLCLENKNHMNYMPVPEGSWQENFKKQQRKYNMMLAGGALTFGVTFYFLYKEGYLYLHDYDHKTFKSKLAGNGSVLIAASETGTATPSGDAPVSTSGDVPSTSKPPPPTLTSGGSPDTKTEDIDWSTVPDIPSHVQYLLIGAGTAAFGAFRAIKSRDPRAKILVIGEEEQVPYMRPPLSKELWFNKHKDEVEKLEFRQWNDKKRSVFYEPKEFFTEPKKLNHLEKGGIALLSGTKVVKLDAGQKTVWLSSGEKMTYDKCLIATGGKPRIPSVIAKADDDVKERTVLFRNIEDFKRLDELTKSAESVAIIGGGFLGSELACALGKRAQESNLKVYQLFPEKGNMGNVLPTYLSKWTTRKIEKEGTEVLPGQTVCSASFQEGKVVLCTKEGKQLNVDCVVAAVGLEPSVELARASNLETDSKHGGFLVNAELEARRDLWVAGDAACFYDVKLGRRRVEHHDHAVVSGRLAGENMTGAAKPYWHQSMFWSDLGPDVGYEAIGIVDASLPTVAVFAKATESDTPKAVVEQTGESLRSETENKAKKSSRSVPPRSSPLDSEDYGKGIVFYLNDKKCVVGILLWNVFNKMSIARQILRDGARNEDLYEVAKLFDIYDTAIEEEDEETATASS